MHRDVFTEQLASKDVQLFSMESDALGTTHPLVTPSKKGHPKQDRDPDNEDSQLKKRLKTLQQQIKQLKDPSGTNSTTTPPGSTKLCGQHLLSLAQLGSRCSTSGCKFLHLDSLGDARVRQVKDTIQGGWSRDQDHATLQTLFSKVQAAVALRQPSPSGEAENLATAPPLSEKPTFKATGGQGRGNGRGRGARSGGRGSYFRLTKADGNK